MKNEGVGKINSMSVRPYMDYSIMDGIVLEKAIAINCGTTNAEKPIVFNWEGDEPLKCGIDFFERALVLERRYLRGAKVVNTLMTSCEGLNDEWAEFFYENNFLVGVFVAERKDFSEPAFAQVDVELPFKRLMPAVEILKRHNVHTNVIAFVNQQNVNNPLTVYNDMKEISNYLQFIPIAKGHDAVSSEAYGDFLSRIMVEWYKNDENKVYVQFIEAILSNYNGCHAEFCIFDTACGKRPAINPDGEMYVCGACRQEHEDKHIGNILEMDTGKLFEILDEKGKNKIADLPKECMQCRYFNVCYGGCPVNRAENIFTGVKMNILCKSYRKLFATFEDLVKVNVSDYSSYLR